MRVYNSDVTRRDEQGFVVARSMRVAYTTTGAIPLPTEADGEPTRQLFNDLLERYYVGSSSFFRFGILQRENTK